MKRFSGHLLVALGMIAVVTACAGQGGSPPVVRNYQQISPVAKVSAKPESVCVIDPGKPPCTCGNSVDALLGGRAPVPDCSVIPSPAACSISSLTVATEPSNTNRTTIGVGEQVTITTNGTNLSASGDGALSAGASPATLTAGQAAGNITVYASGSSCEMNDISFSVIAPSAAVYTNYDGSAYHTQGLANIGVESYIYLAPGSVSFQFLDYEEVQAVYNGTGSWSCMSGAADPAGGVPIQVQSTVTGTGTLAGYDKNYSGSCPGNQIQASTETLVIPTQYMLASGGGWYGINTVTSSATETTAGALTISKSQATAGGISVNSASSGW
jgi:hypothetical protein